MNSIESLFLISPPYPRKEVRGLFKRVTSASVLGVSGYPVWVEVDLTPGIPSFSVVGLPDTAIREARERVMAAIKNSGFPLTLKRITVNLSPAHIRKEGPTFDLPMAVAILYALDLVPEGSLSSVALIGELSLDGKLRSVKGVLPMVEALKAINVEKVILPKGNGKEGALIEGIDVIPMDSLKNAVSFLRGEYHAEPVRSDIKEILREDDSYPDLSDVRGQWAPKRALEIAAAGGHNLLLIGPPGSGKTMLARRLPGIMPPMEVEEALETTKVHSVAGVLPYGKPMMVKRPFRAPHHTISDAGLVGGGAIPRPGEVSLAHNGVLFLDELPEFHRNVLEVLRQPMEEGYVTISRARLQVRYPAKFLLVAAMNPCPCGYRGDPKRTCTCTAWEIKRYISKISGPLLDRIDLHIEVPAVSYKELWERDEGEGSALVRERVISARKIQSLRFKDVKGVRTNSDMGPLEIKRFCKIDEASKDLVKTALERFGLSARAFHRILKVARTIADLEGAEEIESRHIAEALQYRIVDRNEWISGFNV